MLRNMTFKVFSLTVHPVHCVYLILSVTAEEKQFFFLPYFSGIFNETVLRPNRMYIALFFFISMEIFCELSLPTTRS